MMTTKIKRRAASLKRPLNSVLTSFVVASFSSVALANPTGPSVAAGNAAVTTNGAELTIQTDGRAIINWQSFSIGSGELTRFVMSGADGAVLNRAMAGGHSQIDGSLLANGRVYLINPNGVVVGASGFIQTQSFIASTRDVTDADFLDGGALTFVGNSSNGIQNLGTIGASDGDIALIGKRVVNSGTLTASQGVVALAAGDEIMLAEPGSARLLVRVDGLDSGGGALIDHAGVINAAQAELQGVGGNLFGLAVNVGGIVNANGSDNRDGRVYLTADVSQIVVSGSIEARDNDGSGGTIAIDSGIGYGSEVNVSGTLDAASTTAGGVINIAGSRISLNEGAHLFVSGDSGAGAVFVGSQESTNYLYVEENTAIEANSLSGDAGNVYLSGAGVYFHGTHSARGALSQGALNLNAGEAVEYTGSADLRAYNDEARFGSVNISTADANLNIASAGNLYLGLLDVDALAHQLNFSDVQISTTGSDRTIDVFTPLSWQSATRLSLLADGNIDINAPIEAANGSLRLTSLNGGVTDLEPATITVRDLWLSAADEIHLANRVVAQNVTLYDVGGRTWLYNEHNELGNVTFVRDLRSQSGEVDIVDSSGGLTLNVSNVGGVSYAPSGNFRVLTNGDLTLSQTFQAQVAGDVTLVAANGVLRNHSSAGADVFGTSSSGLGRTRIYAAAAGEHGGVQGSSQHEVSYPQDPASTASTVFYYSGSAPQGPNPNNPGPSDPVDPPSPPSPPQEPNLPTPPALPPAQIIQAALDGNSFEQLNNLSLDDLSRLGTIQTLVPPIQPPADPSNWSTGKTDQLEALAQLANIDPTETTGKRPRDPVDDQPQPDLRQQQILDQLNAFIAQLMASMQEVLASQGKDPNLSRSQLSEMLAALPPPVMQMLSEQSPAQLQQQLAVMMAAFAMEQRSAALDAREQARDQQRDQLQSAAEQMREAASTQLAGAIIQGLMQIAHSGAGMSAGGLKNATTTVPPGTQQPSQTNLPTSMPSQGPVETNPPPGASQGSIVLPPTTLPSAVQARLDAINNARNSGR